MRRRVFVILYLAVFTALAVSLALGAAAYYVNPYPDRQSARLLEGFRYTFAAESGLYDISLPHIFRNLEPGTPITFYTEVNPGEYENLLVKTVYTNLLLYADDVLIYESGRTVDASRKNALTEFLERFWRYDPPTINAIISLPPDAAFLRFEFISPSQRDYMSVHEVVGGDAISLLFWRASNDIVLFVVSVIMIFFGFFLLSVSAFAFLFPTSHISRRRYRRNNSVEDDSSDSPINASDGLCKMFLWLGLFAVIYGCAGFGECNLTALLFPYPLFLHFISYLGLFLMIVPLIQYGLIALKPRNPQILIAVNRIVCLTILAVLLLHALGIAAISKTFMVILILNTVSAIIFTSFSLWEYYLNNNPHAKLLATSNFVFCFFSSLELLNYYFRFTYTLGMFSLVGVLVYLFFLAITGERFSHKMIIESAEKKRIEDEIEYVNLQLEMQREQFTQVAENTQVIKAMRHDLRHHLAAIASYAEAEDFGTLKRYLSELTNSVYATSDRFFCANPIVNAVVAHYLNIAENEGVTIEANLDIPEETGIVLDIDLCVVIGNLLENAMDACRRMEQGRKFIYVYSRIARNTLSFTVENSFDGICYQQNGAFLSRKKEKSAAHEGIGLSSVKAVCDKYHGLMEFDIQDNIWRVMTLVHMVNPFGDSEKKLQLMKI